ncbi:hypothetical protein QSE00_19565 [Arenibacter sp. M-2]|uniref:hypothetical protein n=1 Tax=Arenibacter sp. M-2 TaxID=3053612 RepID=UPI002570AD13|nr:hypothetical protein [Arenibacter sp. M-2]MDL5514023.1 hypothetical protein [Arenibacter sp. M-2]
MEYRFIGFINRDVRLEDEMPDFQIRAIERAAEELSVSLEALKASLNPSESFKFSTPDIIAHIEDVAKGLIKINETRFDPCLFD